MKSFKVITFPILFLVTLAMLANAQDTLNRHPVRLDGQSKLLSWVQPQDQAYDRVVRLAWDFLINRAPVQENGLKAYYTYCCLDQDTRQVRDWPHNPAGLHAMLVDSATAYYAYSGDRGPVELARSLVDYQLAHGTTPAGWAWARVPYASSNSGALDYRGADGFLYSEKPNTGDGYGYIEPDKVGELGYGYLKLYEMTGNQVYRESALACADALAKNVRTGEAERSPWPFRVNAETGVIREEYSANVIGAIKLFTELARLNMGNVAAYRHARTIALDWMMKYPMHNHAWSGYFEDVYKFEKPVNFNQYSAMETARYLMQHPEDDPEWRKHVPELVSWVEKTFIFVDVKNEPGVQWDANTVSEQIADMNKMGSHTSRYASINAQWYELTGDAEAREKAFRSFNWASYMCRENGWVNVGPVDQSLWFSDGYGDYIRHFLAGMGSVPEWAPTGQTHLLQSTSLITEVKYGMKDVSYAAFDAEGSEVLKLNFTPRRVLADGKLLSARDDLNQPGWKFEPNGGVLRIRRSGAKTVRITCVDTHSEHCED
jgi:hypothetical protein